MVIIIDKASQEPLYLQIRQQIVAAIARGELAPGDVLPSVRALASNLGVNLHTVNKAYAMLQDEGHVVMRGRSGTIVADPPHSDSAQERALRDARVSGLLEQLAAEYRACGGNAEEFTALAAQAIQAQQATADKQTASSSKESE